MSEARLRAQCRHARNRDKRIDEHSDHARA